MNIQNGAKESLGERKVNDNKPTLKKIPWFCQDVKQKSKEKRIEYLE